MGSRVRSKTWLCKKQVGGTLKAIFAKVTTAPYPSKLHEEAGKAGLVPQLSEYGGRFPGNQYLIEMEYLDPRQGWVSLGKFDGDWASARLLLMELLDKWQDCCGGQAVHGELRPPNIFLRYGHPSFFFNSLHLMGRHAPACMLCVSPASFLE